MVETLVEEEVVTDAVKGDATDSEETFSRNHPVGKWVMRDRGCK